MHWTHVATEPDWKPVTWREFKAANALMDEDQLRWTDKVKHELNRRGWCACDAGNGGVTIVLATDRHGVVPVELLADDLGRVRPTPPRKTPAHKLDGASVVGRSENENVS